MNITRYLSSFIFFITLICLPYSLHAQEYENTFLWKVDKEGQPTSYLMGTVHIGKASDQFSQPLLEAFNQTKTLVTETVLEPTQEETMQLSQLMINWDPSIYQSEFDAKTIEQLAKIISEKVPGLTAEQVVMLKPWALFSLMLYPNLDGYSIKYGVDLRLNNLAKEQHKNLLPLDPLMSQIDIFRTIPEPILLNSLKSNIQHDKEIAAISLELMEYYRNNQVNKLMDLTEDRELNLKYIPDSDKAFWEDWLYNQILYNRSQSWIPTLDKQFAKESTFVAIGAAHLFGEKGVIEGLRTLGYQVTPIMQ